MAGDEKTEKPTERKRKESRKEGQVPRTQELGGWASMLAVGMALPALMGREMTALSELMTTALTATADADISMALRILGQGLWHVLFTLVLLGLGVMIIGVASALAQGGFFLATKQAKPKFSKINPLQGAKRIFGPQSLWEGAKMLIKSALVGVLVYSAIKNLIPLIGGMVPMSVVIDQFFGTALGLIRNIAVAGIVMAAADYAMSRRRIGKQTRMTKQEVKQEHKNTEGDPLIKSAIRSRQLAAARNRMMSDVPMADVVLVNPTHVAIALKYDAERGAPRVVARGAGEVAAKIRAKASESAVPLVRDIPLTRALYTSTRVGQEVPPELFNAVAQVLAFVISRRNHGQTGGEHSSPRMAGKLPDVPRVRPRRRIPSDGTPTDR
ncbi:MAG: EscU/YscU/HrcU family type III secretion system export apparatus switch protein [Nocardioides sp.]|nr:EscU/YscU/HrcU family type III secretion system export apparatus switch protein [Nocardioides sp.]